MNNVKLPPGYVLIALDVVSLFTNICLELVTSILDDEWQQIQLHCQLDKEWFLWAVSLIFK